MASEGRVKLQGQVEIERWDELLQLRAFVRELVERGALGVRPVYRMATIAYYECRGCDMSARIAGDIRHANWCAYPRALALLDDPDGERARVEGGEPFR